MPRPAGMAAFEGRVHMLWQTSADSHHTCRIHGVSCFHRQAVLVTRLCPHSLANQMMSESGQPRQKGIKLAACCTHCHQLAGSLFNSKNGAHSIVCHNQRLDIRNPFLLHNFSNQIVVSLGDRQKLPMRVGNRGALTYAGACRICMRLGSS